MRLVPFYRDTLLLTGPLLPGVATVQVADQPRQITGSRGIHTLEGQPQRIVSTSVTLTGSLLAIDAPVIISGVTTSDNRVVDDQGLLYQWNKVTKERKLQRLYIGEPSAEAVAAQMPDLILISAIGGDSALALYDQLSTIAPVLIINYDDKSWQSLLTQLGETTGHEKQVAERIAQSDRRLTAAKEQIKLSSQSVTTIVYTAAACSANFWTPESTQGQMLEQFGFTLAKLPTGLSASQNRGKHHGIIQFGGENLAARLDGESLFLFAGDQKDADTIYANPLLARLPAIQNKQVYVLGTETFRLDYCNVTQVLRRLKALL